MNNTTPLRLLYTMLTVLCCTCTHLAFAEPPHPTAIVEVADVGKSKELVAALATKEITAVIPPKNIRVIDEQNNCAVWIGKDVPLETVRVVLNEALPLYPYLKFFYVVGDRGEKPPATIHNTIHIGGSMEAALLKRIPVISQEELKKALASFKTAEELHKYLHEKNIPQEPASKADSL